MASYQWIKLYDEILDDPKMGRLSDGAYRFCINLFLLAGRQETRDGALPDMTDIAWTLRLSDEQASTYASELEKAGIISRQDNDIIVTNFQSRQGATTSTERSRQSRERSKSEAPAEKRNDSLQKPQRSRDTWATKLWRSIPARPGIYKMSCSGAGMVYIGASVNMQSRIRAHLSEMSSTPHHAMSEHFAEYGSESITVSVLEECTEDLLRSREQYWIEQHPEDSTYNTQNFSKRHRDWPDQQDDATNRCIDIDKREKKKKREKKSPPPQVWDMITAISAICAQTYSESTNHLEFEDAAYALIGNNLSPADVAKFGEWWARGNGFHRDKPFIKNILSHITAARDAKWADVPKSKKQSANGNGFSVLWGDLTRLMNAYGADRKPELSPEVDSLVRRVGGWSTLCRMDLITAQNRLRSVYDGAH